jgi:hypothetical protein
MKLKIFSIIWSIIYTGWGLGLMIIPASLMAIYGLSLDSSGILMTRLLGTALTSFGLTFWLNQNILPTVKGWYNLLLTSFIYNLIAIPLALMATLEGVMSPIGWIAVGLHIFLAATFGYFSVKKY